MNASGRELVGESTPSGYIAGLDGMRAIAICCVLFAHGFEQFSDVAHLSHWALIITEVAGRLGTFGVKLFFAISGYLICSRLTVEVEKDGARPALARFYVRRAFRILPPLVPYLSLLTIAGALRWLPVSRIEIASAAFFFSNYILVHSWYTLHFWSLAVEEHFYLLWAPVLAFLGQARAAWTAVAVIVCTSIFRPMVLTHASNVVATMSQTQMVLDYFMFPCLLALGMRHPKIRTLTARFANPLVLGGLLLVIAALSRVKASMPGLDSRTVEAGVFALLVVLPTLRPNTTLIRLLETKHLRWVGKRSYGLYVWQQLFLVPNTLAFGLKIVMFILHSALAIAVAAVSYTYLESGAISRGRSIANRIYHGTLGVTKSATAIANSFDAGLPLGFPECDHKEGKVVMKGVAES